MLDLYQTNADQPALLYRNVSEGVGNWINLHLIGTESNRDAIGARLTMKAGSTTLIREVSGANGYSAQSSYRVHFGLGAIEKIDSLEIRWPSGRVETVEVPLNALTFIQEGKGIVEGSRP
jgi:enediyne biosynthesis protein E4